MNYDKQYFIDKFEAIPDHEIGTGSIYNHCALWHCGCTGSYDHTRESFALCGILYPLALAKGFYATKPESVENVYKFNDSSTYIKGDTPKERILNALRSV